MIDPRHPRFTLLPGSSRGSRTWHRAPEVPLPPLVRIASVACGRASTLHDTLRSLQGQTLRRWQWVIADRTDGSPRSRDVMARLAAEPRVHVSGASDDADAALAVAARGDTPYICFLRPGDLLEPTALETWAWALATTPDAHAVTSAAVRFGLVEQVEEVVRIGAGGRPADYRSPSVLFVTRAGYEAIGGIDPAWSAADDIEALACAFADRGHHVGVLPAHHVWRRVHDLADPITHRLSIVPPPRRPFRPPQFANDPPFENPLSGEGRGVLFVLPYMFQGGAERASLDQATVLAARGWRVTIVALGRVSHTWRPAFCAVTGDVHVANELSLAWADWDRTMPELPRFLSYLLTSRAIDVMLLGGTMPGYGMVPWLRRQHPRVAFAAARHATDWPLMSFEAVPLLDAVLVSTATLLAGHEALGIPADRVHRIVTGVDTNRWRPDPERRATLRRWLQLPPDAPVLIYSSRLSADKQPMVFAQTLALLRDRGVDIYALVTGSGAEQLPLTRRLAELRLTERVRLLGEVPDHSLPGLVACADVGFLPSQREGIALSLLESMAAGLPFVSTSASSQGEVVTPDVGALVPRGTPEEEASAYAEALARIVGDRQNLAAMGRRARQLIDESWSHARMGDQLEAALEAAIGRARRGSREDEIDAVTRCAAAAAMHAVCLDLTTTLNQTVVRLLGVLERLGYDSDGQPLSTGPGPGSTDHT